MKNDGMLHSRQINKFIFSLTQILQIIKHNKF